MTPGGVCAMDRSFSIQRFKRKQGLVLTPPENREYYGCLSEG